MNDIAEHIPKHESFILRSGIIQSVKEAVEAIEDGIYTEQEFITELRELCNAYETLKLDAQALYRVRSSK